jgi:hypothetical protein
MLTLIRQSVWGRDFGVSGSSIGCAKAMLGSVFDVVFREPLPGFIEDGEVSDELAIGIIRSGPSKRPFRAVKRMDRSAQYIQRWVDA